MRSTRKHHRIIKRLETEFSAGDVSLRGISSDLSEKGLFVRTSKPFAPATLVDLVLHLPDSRAARLKARVCWAAKNGPIPGRSGMGLEIVQSDDIYSDYLLTLLNARHE